MKNIFILNQKRLFLVIITAFAFLNTKAQVGGNQVYKSRSYNEQRVNKTFNDLFDYSVTDSTVVIQATVLLNKVADKYKITLGVNEEAATPKKSIENINKRIHDFINKIAVIGVKKNEVFVDFISQTKIYDYEISKNQNMATQKNNGFEIKKNVMITVDQYSKIEKLIYEASDFQIYDVIKVDYINTDIEKIQKDLLREAYSVLDKKKDNYFALVKKEIIGLPTVSSNFSYVFPKGQYQNYTAYESSDVDYIRTSNESFYKKELRKGKTFYYEGVDYSDFDKIINDENPEVGIQYIMNISAKYDVKKNKK